jgi:AraC family transcriptional regulator
VHRTTLIEGESLSVYDFRCSAGPADRPFAELHVRHSLSYVRRGSFGCRTRGREYDLVAGALMVGRPGQEYIATHEHHGCGDECLSIKLEPGLVDSLGSSKGVWELACVPPLPELMVLAELVQAAAEKRASLGVEEAAMLLLDKFSTVASGKSHPTGANPKERRRAVDAALWLEENFAAPIRLEDAAREVALSPYHFLRLFRNVVGATPHQYLLRLRLRRAAKLLAEQSLPVTEVALDCGFADLSNFVRTFGRAAGVSPQRFRRASNGERRIFQARLAAAVLA